MIIFLNLNNLNVFSRTVKAYSENVKKYKFIIGRQDLGLLNKKDMVISSDDEVVEVLLENGILNFELLHASKIDKFIPNEWKNSLYKTVLNLSTQIFAPWFIHNYMYNDEDILTIEEDIILRLNDNFINKLDKSSAMFSSLSLGSILYKNIGESWIRLQNGKPNDWELLKKRKIWGCPKFYTSFDLNEFTKYFDKVFSDLELSNYYKDKLIWHHEFIDELIFSYSPINFKPFDKTVAKYSSPGEKGIVKFTGREFSNCWNNCIIHISGTTYKLIAINRVLSEMNAEV